MKGQYTKLATALTTNTTLGPFVLSGDHVIAITGTLGGATIEFFHKMDISTTTTPNYVELTRDATMSFTAKPAPFPYLFAAALPLYIQISGGTAASINILAAAIGSNN